MPLVSIATEGLVLVVHGRSTWITIKHHEVTMAFLKSRVIEELYVTLSKGVVLHKGRLMASSGTDVQVRTRLLKSLYGLKQVHLDSFKTLDKLLTSIGLKRLKGGPEIYVLCREEKHIGKAILARDNDMILFDDNNENVKRLV